MPRATNNVAARQQTKKSAYPQPKDIAWEKAVFIKPQKIRLKNQCYMHIGTDERKNEILENSGLHVSMPLADNMAYLIQFL